MLIDKIPQNELNIIDWYRSTYTGNNLTSSGEKADIEYVLREWEKQKNKFLINLFGGKLILKKQVNYEKTISELCDDFSDINTDYGNVYRNFKNKVLGLCDSYGELNKIKYVIIGLFEIENLMKNEVPAWLSETEWKIKLPGQERLYEIKAGMKIMKVFGAIAKAFKLTTEYEDFRKVHSLALNQKITKGNLCISIHPLDYITMSDNDSNWNSCMRWQEDGDGDAGEYRQGTIEMMNSPGAIVAYLESEHSMKLNSKYSWNNKRWRELFVVSPKMMVGVKGYPYGSNYLEDEVYKFIREIAALNCGITYETNYYRYTGSRLYLSNEKTKYHHYWFNTHHMYCDFGCADGDHRLYLATGITPESLETSDFMIYSGSCECMWCGRLNCEIEDNAILCDNCMGGTRCSCCENYFDDEDIIWVDNRPYCRYCYEESIEYDTITEEPHNADDMIRIYLSRCVSSDIEATWKNNHTYINIYNPYTLKKFLKKDFGFSDPYKELKVDNGWGSYTDHCYLNWDDLNKDGKQLFLNVMEEDTLPDNYILGETPEEINLDD